METKATPNAGGKGPAAAVQTAIPKTSLVLHTAAKVVIYFWLAAARLGLYTTSSTIRSISDSEDESNSHISNSNSTTMFDKLCRG